MPSSFCFYLYTENLSLPVFVPILAYKRTLAKICQCPYYISLESLIHIV